MEFDRRTRAPAVRDLAIAWLHLAVLWSFAFAQPLFGVLADSPEFFVARGNTTADIVLLAFGLVLIPPTLMVAVEAALWRLPGVRALVHLVFVGGLTTAVAMQIFKSWKSGPGIGLTALALAVGVGAGFLYARAPAARSTLTVLAPMPVLFLFLFLVTSPVADLFASDEDVPVRQDVRATAPVVAIVFDEFSVETLMDPNGRIDRARYPRFAELADSATWFRNATTISDHTTDAVPAVLTGRYPNEDALPTASDQPRSLFTFLGGAYSLANVTEPATDLCPSRLCSQLTRPPAYDRLESLGKDLTIVGLHRVLPQRLAAELPAVDQGFGNFAAQGRDTPTTGDADVPDEAAAQRPEQFGRFLGGIDRDRRDSLNFIHVLLPHTAWQYLPTGQQYTPPPGNGVPGVDDNGIWTKDPALPLQSFQRELLQVGYVDRLLGRTIQRLRSEGLYDEALFILTADHGISFRPGSSRRSAIGPGAPDVLGVPLFVKAPRQERGEVDDRNATTADILPTVADAIGADLGWETAGRSLLSFPRPPSDPVTVSVFPKRTKESMPFEQYVDSRDDEVVAMHFRAGPGTGWGGVYAMGADSDLFGRSVAALPKGAPSGMALKLDDADAYESVDPGAAVVPALVSGTLDGPAQAGQRLVVAVNGVVRGAAPTYSDAGQIHFGTLVPASAFRRGRNAVTVFLVAGEGPSRRLSPVERFGEPG